MPRTEFAGVSFQRQLPIGLEYKRVRLDCGYRADPVVENTVFVELKSLDALMAIHEAQLLSTPKIKRFASWLDYQF